MNHDPPGTPFEHTSPNFSNWTSHAPAPFAPPGHWSREPHSADPLVSLPTDVDVADGGPDGLDPVGDSGPKDPSLSDLRDELRRATAEVEAVRSRLEREAVRARLAARSELVMALVPVLDNLDRALATASADKALALGVEMVRAQFEAVLAGYGLVPIVAVGARFDPTEHEAVAIFAVTRHDQDGVVHDVLSRGYRFDGRVLVPARVRVGRITPPRRSP